jgi:hypothetical protein
MKSWVTAGACALGLALTSSAAAEPLPPDVPWTCSRGANTALAELACELGQGLESVPAGALVVSAPPTGDTKISAGLGARIAAVVAAALHKGAKSLPDPATLGHAQTLASQAPALIYLAPEVVGGEIRVVADAYRVSRKFWDRVRNPLPVRLLHTFASRRIDAEVRTFLPAVPLVAGRVDRATSPEKGILALACDDVDGDGALEIVVAGRRQILFGRVRGGKLVPNAAVAWNDLSPVAPSPLRQPIGGIAIHSGLIDVGISDRANALRLDEKLAVVGRANGRMPWPGGGCAELADGALRGLGPCLDGDPISPHPALVQSWDALGGAAMVTREGGIRTVRVARHADEAKAELVDDRGHHAEVTGVGAQLALGDLDGDCQPELLSGTNTLDPASDALVVHTWQQDDRVRERYRIPVPKGVRAIAVCPAEGPGRLPFVIAAGDEIWVAR